MGGRCGCGDGGGWLSGSYGCCGGSGGGKYYGNSGWWWWTVGVVVLVVRGKIGWCCFSCFVV